MGLIESTLWNGKVPEFRFNIVSFHITRFLKQAPEKGVYQQMTSICWHLNDEEINIVCNQSTWKNQAVSFLFISLSILCLIEVTYWPSFISSQFITNLYNTITSAESMPPHCINQVEVVQDDPLLTASNQLQQIHQTIMNYKKKKKVYRIHLHTLPYAINSTLCPRQNKNKCWNDLWQPCHLFTWTSP